MTDLSPPDLVPGVPDKTARADKPGWVPHIALTERIDRQKKHLANVQRAHSELRREHKRVTSDRHDLLLALEGLLLALDATQMAAGAALFDWPEMGRAQAAIKKAKEGTQHA